MFDGSIIWTHQTHIAQKNLFLQLHNRVFYLFLCVSYTHVCVWGHTCVHACMHVLMSMVCWLYMKLSNILFMCLARIVREDTSIHIINSRCRKGKVNVTSWFKHNSLSQPMFLPPVSHQGTLSRRVHN